jgi:putative flippase GtrA
VAGGFASLLNWLVRFPLSRLAPFEVAVGLAYGVGMLAGFGLYRSWVFPGSTLPLRSQIARFVAVNAAGLLVVVFGAALLVAAIGWTGLLAPPAAEALAHGLAILGGAIVNFLGHRAVTFARRVVRRV